jgi:PadR family transcriptional regulator, regulatory protein PadR
MEQTNDWNSQLRRGLLEFCILALIEQEPRYGYEIVTRLAEAPQLAAGEGTIYPLLRRLKKDGLVETFWVESAAGPPRQYYRLMAPGQEALGSMRSEWRQLVAAVDGFVAGG